MESKADNKLLKLENQINTLFSVMLNYDIKFQRHKSTKGNFFPTLQLRNYLIKKINICCSKLSDSLFQKDFVSKPGCTN